MASPARNLASAVRVRRAPLRMLHHYPWRMGVGTEKYVNITTFTASGEEKTTPVWITDLADGRVGFCTAADSWKVRRISRDPAVRLQPCDRRGNPPAGSAIVAGAAELLAEDSDGFREVRAGIDAKYGLAARAAKAQLWVQGLLGRSEAKRCAVVIRLE